MLGNVRDAWPEDGGFCKGVNRDGLCVVFIPLRKHLE